MPRVCVFDVNETLLDLSSLDPHFERAFGDASVRRAWFLQVLQSAMVATPRRGCYPAKPARTAPWGWGSCSALTSRRAPTR